MGGRLAGSDGGRCRTLAPTRDCVVRWSVRLEIGWCESEAELYAATLAEGERRLGRSRLMVGVELHVVIQ